MSNENGKNRTDWMPSSKQIEIVELLINPDDKRSKLDKMAAADVRKSTFYDWMKNPHFVEYMNKQLEKYTNGELPEVWKALMRKCKMGDISAIKLFFEMKGMYSEKKKIEVAGANGGPMELVITIDYGDDDIIERGVS